MANDDYDNAITDREMLERAQMAQVKALREELALGCEQFRPALDDAAKEVFALREEVQRLRDALARIANLCPPGEPHGGICASTIARDALAGARQVLAEESFRLPALPGHPAVIHQVPSEQTPGGPCWCGVHHAGAP